MPNEIYICQDGWVLYDQWVASTNKKEKKEYRIEFMLHRCFCELCTQISVERMNEEHESKI